MIANDFEARKSGSIIGISSVAGDRVGRVIIFTDQRKRDLPRFFRSSSSTDRTRVHVLTVKPVRRNKNDRWAGPAGSTDDHAGKDGDAIFEAFEKNKFGFITFLYGV